MSNEHPELQRRSNDDLDPAIAAALWHAYSEDVDVDTAARHLWRIHRAANSPLVVSGRGTRRALVAVLTGLMLLMSTGGALAASASTVPGDALYSVKRTVERTRLLLAISPETDARLHLAMARQRLTEADTAAVKRPAVVPRLIEDAAASVEHAERNGGPEVAEEAFVLREEVSQKAVALAVTLEDQESKDLLADISERLTPAGSGEQATVMTVPPSRDEGPPPVVEEEEPAPAEPPIETATSTPSTTPEPTAPVVPSPAPRPQPPTSEPTPEASQEPEPEEPAEEESTGGELPPADPRGSPGIGKETQDLKPEPEPESGTAEDEQPAT